MEPSRQEALALAARLVERHGPSAPARAERMANLSAIPAERALWRLTASLAAELLRIPAADAAHHHRTAA